MNILIVDDDPDLVALARARGPRGGPRRHRAGRARDAGARPLPDLVLLDVMLPRIDGFAVLKKIRADERLARVPVVIVSGVADRHEDVARAKALGADDYIVKPLMEYHFLGRVARFAKAK